MTKMSYRVFTIISLAAALLLAVPSALAGLHTALPFSASDYYMYRVYPSANMSTLMDEAERGRLDKKRDEARRNCLEWQAMLSPSVTMEDIYQVLYQMPYEEVAGVYAAGDYDGANSMLRDLLRGKRQALLDYLLFAKKVEYLRGQVTSAWYYPTMRLDGDLSFEALIDEALDYRDEELRPRYVLQAVRLLFSMQRYEECIDLWEQECVRWSPRLLMREMIESYVIGARFRLHAETLDTKYLAEVDDVSSLLFCAGRMGKRLRDLDKIRYVYRYIPHSRSFDKLFFEYIRQVTDRSQAEEFIAFADSCLAEGRLSDPALWHYTIAYLQDQLLHDSEAALEETKRAERARGSDYIHDSIKLLRIYLDEKLTDDAHYEAMLSRHLRWLDKKICENLTDEIKAQAKGGAQAWSKMSYFYWDDMLRRVVLEVAVPRLLEQGKVVRALQVANMAENMVKKYAGTYPLDPFHETIDKESGEVKIERVYNYEYANEFAQLLYRLSPEEVIAYLTRIEHPLGALDTFLNQRGYTDTDYLCDIIGTKYLAAAEYGAAQKYLSRVSSYFRGVLNTEEYYVSDPFCWEATPREGDEEGYFKLNFAREMLFLEEAMDRSTNPNTRARLMLTYATGMRNSVGRSWPLTGYREEYKHLSKEELERQMSASVTYLKVLGKALGLMTDEELIARTQYALGNYRTVAQSCPGTAVGSIVLGSCDRLIDYHWEERLR